MKPGRFTYHRADSIGAALEWLADEALEIKVLAGGQSLVPLLNMRLARPAALVDINPIRELAAITVAEGGCLRLGATVRHSDVIASSLVRDRAPLLAAATAHIGHRAIRNLGTLGGSLAHADPAAELAAVLVAVGGDVVVGSHRGMRTVSAEDLVVGPFLTSLLPTELLCAVHVPDQRGWGWGFAEVARRPGDFAIAGVAASVRLQAGVCQAARLLAFGVGDGPVRLVWVESLLIGGPIDAETARRAGEIAAEGVAPPPADVHASADYRRHLVAVLTERVVLEANDRARKAGQESAAGRRGESEDVDAREGRGGGPVPASVAAELALRKETAEPDLAKEAAELAPAKMATEELYEVRVTVNGLSVERRVQGRRSLVDFLRHDLGLRGTHVGCEHGVCGACTVLVNGRSARSCLLFAAQLDGGAVTTIEGLTPADGLSPLQAAFRECFALQCGFCTPGMIVASHELLAENPAPTEAQIREALSGNLCMCTGYVNIVRAVQRTVSGSPQRGPVRG